MGQTWRTRGQPSADLQPPQFRRPVRQCQAQTFHVRMPSAELEFHVRHLLAATSYSLRPLLAFRSDLFEGPVVAVQLGLVAAECLPALHDHINVFRVQFHSAADALGEFSGGQRGTAAKKRLVHHSPRLV